MQSGLPADAASLRETGSVDMYTPRGPVSRGLPLGYEAYEISKSTKDFKISRKISRRFQISR